MLNIKEINEGIITIEDDIKDIEVKIHHKSKIIDFLIAYNNELALKQVEDSLVSYFDYKEDYDVEVLIDHYILDVCELWNEYDGDLETFVARLAFELVNEYEESQHSNFPMTSREYNGKREFLIEFEG